ncbi:MAG: antibiotic biosynthesis monooxygenase [Dehalococcoidia bacterium]
MIAITARLHADPGKEVDVRKALSTMVQDASTRQPSMPGYSLLASEKDPTEFLMYAEFTSVEDRLPEARIDELMQLGTGLRESLREPIEIERYVVVAEK